MVTGYRRSLLMKILVDHFVENRVLMKQTRVTASEFQISFGALSDKARQQPVIITKHGRDSLVVMSAEEWERLKRRDRRVGLTADLPDEWIEAVRNSEAPEDGAAIQYDAE